MTKLQIRRRTVLAAAPMVLAAPYVARAQNKPEKTKVVLAVGGKSALYYLSLTIAETKGFFKEAGLDVEIREGGPSVSGADELLSGRAEFAVGTSAALVRRLQGAPLVVLAAVFQHSPTTLLVRRGAERPSLYDAQDLRLLDAPESEDIDAMLMKHGVDYARMRRVAHDGSPQLLVSGQADAMIGYSTNEPFLLDEQSVHYTSFSPRDRGIDFYGDNLVTTQTLVDRHPELVRAFREASLKGWRYALSHQAELVELILDKAGQKGTGRWTLQNAAENAVVVSTINAAVEARVLSSQKAQRVVASRHLDGPMTPLRVPKAELVAKVHDALYASKIVSYTQGLDLMRSMSARKDWQLDLGGIASIWRGGCIIRARFLGRITDAYRADPQLANLMLAPFFRDLLNRSQGAWRQVVATAVTAGIPVPAFSASLAYFDSLRSARLPANLLQAQRDFFGAHGYERTDAPAGQVFHHAWPEVIG